VEEIVEEKVKLSIYKISLLPLFELLQFPFLLSSSFIFYICIFLYHIIKNNRGNEIDHFF